MQREHVRTQDHPPTLTRTHTYTVHMTNRQRLLST